MLGEFRDAAATVKGRCMRGGEAVGSCQVSQRRSLSQPRVTYSCLSRVSLALPRLKDGCDTDGAQTLYESSNSPGLYEVRLG